MTSWSPTNQHPDYNRRSSRSHSPRRRDKDGDMSHDYSSAHSGYGQDRGWDDYYEKRGRGRSRSPGDDSGRKRRRSHSPYERDRFEPRPRYGDDYDTHSRAHGYSSPRSKNGGHYPLQQHSPSMNRSNRPPLADPYLHQPQAVGLRQYADWFRATYPKEAKEEDDADRAAEKEAGRKTRDGIRARWEKYKKKHLSMQLQTLFDHHKRSPWFSEKYNPAPEWINLRNRVRKQGWKGRPEQFLKDLEEGKYDPKRESDSAGKDTTVLADEKAPPEDVDAPDEDAADIPFETSAKTEMNGKQGGQNGRQYREDDVAVFPDGNQIAIRTIPPDIGRQKIEEACRTTEGFIHLALGDPLQKRQYYRAGWMKFRDDVDMTQTLALVGEKKIDGFKLHVSHVARPYYGRLRQAPTTLQRIEKDLQQVKQLASILEDEYAALRTIKGGEPEPKLDESKSAKDGEQDAAMSEEQPASTNEVENAEPEQDVEYELYERGSEAVERRIEKLAAELLTQQDNGDGEGSDSKFESNKSIIALDLYVAYVRAAFNTCYYCAAVCDHVEELNRKCPKHVRKMILEKVSPSGADDAMEHQKDDEDKSTKDQSKEKDKDRREKNDDSRRMEVLDSKIALLINRFGIDPLDYGGKNPEEELKKVVEPHIKQEEEGKFRCRTCTKLFKAASFVEKHISNKHPELIKQLDELPFFNNFAMDPNRVQPFTHLPPAVGNNIPNPHAYGLQAPPPAPYPIDYARPPVPGFYGGYPAPPPPYAPYSGQPGMYEYYLPTSWPPPQGRRDDHPHSGRRLQERMGGYASTTHLTLTGAEGLPPKPVAAIESSGHDMGGGGGGGGGGMGGGSGGGGGGGEKSGGGGGGGRRRGRASTGGPPPPPPPDAKEDPRAAAGRKVSYHDMDDVAEGDVELTY